MEIICFTLKAIQQSINRLTSLLLKLLRLTNTDESITKKKERNVKRSFRERQIAQPTTTSIRYHRHLQIEH